MKTKKQKEYLALEEIIEKIIKVVRLKTNELANFVMQDSENIVNKFYEEIKQ